MIDKTAIRIVRLGEAGSDTAYWRTQSVRRRLSTVEEIRREYHGWRGPSPPADLMDFAGLLSRHKVAYLIVGGYAVAFHGHPRYTKDLDIWIEREAQNGARVIAALNEFGFGSLDLTEKDFLQPERVIQLGTPPSRVDLLTDLKGVTFPEAYLRRVTDWSEGTPLHFIGLEDLIANKRAVGRHLDLADLENLE